MIFFGKKIKYCGTNFRISHSDSKSNLKTKMTVRGAFFHFNLFWNFIRKMFSF